MHTHTHTHTHIYIYIVQNCIKNALTCFGASAPSAGSLYIVFNKVIECRSQWPRGLRRRSTAARLLRSWVRIPPRVWMFVCCVLSGRGLCDGLITRPEESYRLWRVVICDNETSQAMRLKPARGL